jgi:hypothetical protein
VDKLRTVETVDILHTVETVDILRTVESVDILRTVETSNLVHRVPEVNYIALTLIYYLFIFYGSAAQRGLWPPRSLRFMITHNDAPQSVGLLWTSDQLVAETST